mmetsp:Transcript_8471/g.18554  ORF Transcript_8471/g.18554 Transcript_8471/m.18554 type:complete len:478 (+) Transcript_8471:1905-3338(+)
MPHHVKPTADTVRIAGSPALLRRQTQGRRVRVRGEPIAIAVLPHAPRGALDHARVGQVVPAQLRGQDGPAAALALVLTVGAADDPGLAGGELELPRHVFLGPVGVLQEVGGQLELVLAVGAQEGGVDRKRQHAELLVPRRPVTGSEIRIRNGDVRVVPAAADVVSPAVHQLRVPEGLAVQADPLRENHHELAGGRAGEGHFRLMGVDVQLEAARGGGHLSTHQDLRVHHRRRGPVNSRYKGPSRSPHIDVAVTETEVVPCVRQQVRGGAACVQVRSAAHHPHILAVHEDRLVGATLVDKRPYALEHTPGRIVAGFFSGARRVGPGGDQLTGQGCIPLHVAGIVSTLEKYMPSRTPPCLGLHRIVGDWAQGIQHIQAMQSNGHISKEQSGALISVNDAPHHLHDPSPLPDLLVKRDGDHPPPEHRPIPFRNPRRGGHGPNGVDTQPGRGPEPGSCDAGLRRGDAGAAGAGEQGAGLHH